MSPDLNGGFGKLLLTSMLLLAGLTFPVTAGQQRAPGARPNISEERAVKIRERLAQAKGETGLNQNEIDAYIGFIGDVAKAGGKRKLIDKAVARTGMTETRLLYIKMKTDAGCMTASGLPASVFQDSGFFPTEQEMELIKANLKPLQNASFLAEFPLPE